MVYLCNILHEYMFIYKYNLKKRKMDEKEKKRLEEAAYLLKALANEIRLCVILQLSEYEEKSVSELMTEMNCSQSLLSHHLTDMRAKGILSCRKSGKNCFYSIKDKRVLQLASCVMKQYT